MFLKILAAVTALAGGWLGLRAAFTSRGTIDELIDLGPIGNLPDGAPEERAVQVTERLGWLSRTVERSVWIRRPAEGDLRVWTSACPHEACVIHKDAGTPGFICLCHRSQFDIDGKVLNGPALRDMDSLEYSVESGSIRARYRKFKKGLRVKEVVS
jgi:nitrite reductase/ring-hydroxylating ferredoxin subunit